MSEETTNRYYMMLYEYTVKCATCNSSYSLLLDLQLDENPDEVIKQYAKCLKCEDGKEQITWELIDQGQIDKTIRFSKLPDLSWKEENDI